MQSSTLPCAWTTTNDHNSSTGNVDRDFSQEQMSIMGQGIVWVSASSISAVRVLMQYFTLRCAWTTTNDRTW
jgi:hypothetical protein